MKSAEGFLVKNGLPKWTKVNQIVQNAETATFKQYFNTWSEPEDQDSTGLGRMYPTEMIGEILIHTYFTVVAEANQDWVHIL